MNPTILALLGLGVGLVAFGGGSGGSRSDATLRDEPTPSPTPSPTRSGGSSGSGDADVRALQSALNLYASLVGQPATRAASCGTFVRWPLAEDGIAGPQTSCAISEVLAQLYADGARNVPGTVVEDGAVVGIFEVPLANFLVEVATAGGVA